MKRFIAAGFTLFVTLYVLCFASFAASKEQEVNIVEKMVNAVFEVAWDKEGTAEVVLVAPSGTEMNAASLGDKYVKKGKSIAIIIAEPAQGKWKVRISGEGLGKVKISLSEFSELIQLNKLNAGLQADGTALFSWEAVNCEENISVSVFADEDNKGFDGIKLTELYANRAGNASVNLNSLSTGSYYFYLKVKDSNEVEDELYTEKVFDYVNPNAPKLIPGVKATLVNDSVRVVWSKPHDDSIKSYKVIFFKQGSGSPVYTYFTENADTLEYLSEPFEEKKLEAAVAAVNSNGLSGEYKKLEVDLNRLDAIGAEVEFPDKDVLNVHNLVLPVKLDNGLKSSLYVNDKLMVENAEKSGSFAVELSDGANLVEVEVCDAAGNIKTFDKKWRFAISCG